MLNTCIKCSASWEVKKSIATLDSIDYDNLKKHNQLYSICEDCNNGICVSISIFTIKNI